MNSVNPYLALAIPAVSSLRPYQPGKPVAELERHYGVTDAIKLASNENPRGPSDAVQKAVSSALNELTRYPDGAAFELRAALARYHGLSANQFTLGNGSNELLVLLAEAFLGPGNNAVYDQYSFIVYRLAVQACGAQARVVPALPADHDGQPLGHDLDGLLEHVDEHTRLVFIANPNNPTGTWVDDEALHDFLRALPAHVLTVLDEAYCDYAQAEGAADAIAWLKDFPNLVVVRTFSKAFGLAALRVGYSVSAPGIAELLNRVRQPFNVNSLAQTAAVAALADREWVQDSVRHNQVCRQQLCDGLRSLGYPCVPSRANFLLVNFGTAEHAANCNEFLLRTGVIVRPVANYGLGCYLRITVGTEAEIERLLHALQAWQQASA